MNSDEIIILNPNKSTNSMQVKEHEVAYLMVILIFSRTSSSNMQFSMASHTNRTI